MSYLKVNRNYMFESDSESETELEQWESGNAVTIKKVDNEQSSSQTMSTDSVTNQPIQILCPTEQNQFFLDEEKLNKVLMNPNIKDRQVCVISVAGAFRKGKSFLLDFFLRYLYAKYVHHSAGDWLGEEDEPLQGFSWRSGSERETTGIIMWSDVFLHDYPDGRKVAILLLDTQGTFDCKTLMRDCATIFALSTLISSVQIYNISSNIQEDDLQNLELFADYGRLALTDVCNKPFQKLQFLVRDWLFKDDHPYGAIGGKSLLRNRLETSQRQQQEHRSVRENIVAYFDEVKCFLMPHPGMKVGGKEFRGCLKDISADFKNNLREFVPSILAPENLIVKKFNGKTLVAGKLIHYIREYVKIFGSNKLPEPKSILIATAEANHHVAINDFEETYNQRLNALVGPNCPYMEPEDLENKNFDIMRELLTEFKLKPKMGAMDMFHKFEKVLKCSLTSAYDNYKQLNNVKVYIAELNHLTKLRDVVSLYDDKLKEMLYKNTTYIKPEEFEKRSNEIKSVMLKQFDNEKKIGGQKVFQKNRDRLIVDMDKVLSKYKVEYENKLSLVKADLAQATMDVRNEFSKMLAKVTTDFLSTHEFNKRIETAKKDALGMFDAQRSEGLEEFFNKYRNELIEDMNKQCATYKQLNEAKEEKLRKYFIESKMDYEQSMQKICVGNMSYITGEALKAKHNELKRDALQKFDSTSKIGIEKYAVEIRKQLEIAIDESFTHFANHNENKLVRAKDQCCKRKAESIDLYKKKMAQVGKFTSVDDLNAIHADGLKSALEFFDVFENLLGGNIFEEVRKELSDEIQSYYKTAVEYSEAGRKLIAVGKVLAILGITLFFL